MARLQPLKFRFESKTGETFAFTSQVSVTSEGQFRLTIPDELRDLAETKARETREIVLIRPRTNLCVAGVELNACKTFVRALGEEYLRCEVIVEQVILYGLQTHVSYAKGIDGGIFPNCELPGAGGKWQGSHDRKKFFSVGFAAFVAEKKTYVRGASKKIEYRKAIVDRDSCAGRLNAFIGLTYETGGFEEIPYSDEAAQFFYNLITGLCRMADRIESFFADNQALSMAIAEQRPLLAEK